MRKAMPRFLVVVVTVFLIGGAAPVRAQGAFAHGTPHL